MYAPIKGGNTSLGEGGGGLSQRPNERSECERESSEGLCQWGGDASQRPNERSEL